MANLKRRTFIKICGLTREADVDAAVQAGADAIGFVLYAKSPRAVTVERALELARRLPQSVTPVLLSVNMNATDLLAVPAGFTGEKKRFILQFHGDESPAQCLVAKNPFWKAARIPVENSQSFDLLKFCQDYAAAQAILVDADSAGFGGSGKRFDWNAFEWSHPQISASSRIVLSGGLETANVQEAIKRVRPFAVDISSGVEAVSADGKPLKGIKDPKKIQDFIAAVRAVDEEIYS